MRLTPGPARRTDRPPPGGPRRGRGPGRRLGTVVRTGALRVFGPVRRCASRMRAVSRAGWRSTAGFGNVLRLAPRPVVRAAAAFRTASARARTAMTGPLHDEKVAARLGVALGVCFAVAFLTGLFSHILQHPGPFPIRPRPAGLYRVTEGLHVITGIAVAPLLLAKLWAVYPKFWDGLREMRERAGADLRAVRARRKPEGLPGTVSLGIGRLSLVPLTGGAIFQVMTGLMNIAYWYPWPFFFTTAHYWTAYIITGALVIHVANQWATARRALARPLAVPVAAGPSRRGFLTAVGAASAVLVAATAGEALPAVRDLDLLGPRRPGRGGPGQAGVPVNRTAAAAGVQVPAAYRLRVHGAVRHEVSWALADLRALPQHTVTLPIACVEGWSVSARWTGVRVRDLLRAAGVADDATVRVESLERGGRYRASELTPAYWHDPATLLALQCDGEDLRADHGHPARLIAPDRPGVLQTKWVSELVVTA